MMDIYLLMKYRKTNILGSQWHDMWFSGYGQKQLLSTFGMELLDINQYILLPYKTKII